jgi:ketosteroid isomerase-like protein
LQQISKSVQTVLRRWASTLLSGDLTAHMDLYAPTVDRFGARSNVTRHFVRAEVERWLSDHDDLLSYRLTDLNVRWFAPEESATAEFRCAWTQADGQSETSHHRLKFRKMTGEWKIVSEEQLSLQSRRRD